MICPQCGFMMTAFDKECPRCRDQAARGAGGGQQASSGWAQPTNPPPAAYPPQPQAYPPQPQSYPPPPPQGYPPPVPGYPPQPQAYPPQPQAYPPPVQGFPPQGQAYGQAPQRYQSASSDTESNPASTAAVIFYAFLSFCVPLAGLLFYFGLRGRSLKQSRVMATCGIVGFILGFILILSGESSNKNSASNSGANGGADTTVPAVAPNTNTSSAVATSAPAASSSSSNCFGDLCVENLNDKQDSGLHYVTGTVVNKGDSKYSYVQVEFNIYDASGAQVESTFDNINNLDAHGRWNFQAMLTDSRATRYQLKGVTAW